MGCRMQCVKNIALDPPLWRSTIRGEAQAAGKASPVMPCVACVGAGPRLTGVGRRPRVLGGGFRLPLHAGLRIGCEGTESRKLKRSVFALGLGAYHAAGIGTGAVEVHGDVGYSRRARGWGGGLRWRRVAAGREVSARPRSGRHH